MGGAAAGEIASSLAVDEILRHLAKDREPGTPLPALAENAVCAANEAVYSRAYRLRNGRLEQVTLDHSLVEEQVRMGRLTEAEALRSPLRNVITRALGTQNCVTPDSFELGTEAGDLFLLCSDGLTREIADPAIESILTSDVSLEDRCSRLIEAAKKAGGHDNITCILVQAA